MIRHGSRSQRTIRCSAQVEGVGYVTGTRSRLRFVPAPPSTGVVFARADLHPEVVIPAHVHQVTGTDRRTTLGSQAGQVTLVEHVLAALAGLRIDNCRVEIDSVEPPGLDGSAQGFVDALLRAGIQQQSAPRSIWTVREPICVSENDKSLTIHPTPTNELKISYFLDYGAHPSLGKQCHTSVITPTTFQRHLSHCRTFILEQEVEALRQQGLGSGTTPADLLIYGNNGVIGNKTHFADEPARHKVLDVVGDLSLLGVDLVGHVIGYRSGHPQNVELARRLSERLKTALGRETRVA